jgi:hypothetical protein
MNSAEHLRSRLWYGVTPHLPQNDLPLAKGPSIMSTTEHSMKENKFCRLVVVEIYKILATAQHFSTKDL